MKKNTLLFFLFFPLSFVAFSQSILNPAATVVTGLMSASTGSTGYAQTYNMGKTGGFTITYTAGGGTPAVAANGTYAYGFDFDHYTNASITQGGSTNSSYTSGLYNAQYGVAYSMDNTVRYFNINNLVKSENTTFGSLGLISTGTGAGLVVGRATNLNQGQIVIAGMSYFNFNNTNSGITTNFPMPIRVTIQFYSGTSSSTYSSSTALPLSQQGDLIFYKIKGGFNVNILVEAYDGVLTSANIGTVSGTTTSAVKASNGAAYVPTATWIPATQLFENIYRQVSPALLAISAIGYNNGTGTATTDGHGNATGLSNSGGDVVWPLKFIDVTGSVPAGVSTSVSPGTTTSMYGITSDATGNCNCNNNFSSFAGNTYTASNTSNTCLMYGFDVGNTFYFSYNNTVFPFTSGAAQLVDGQTAVNWAGASTATNLAGGVVELDGLSQITYLVYPNSAYTATIPVRFIVSFSSSPSGSPTVPVNWQDGVVYYNLPNGTPSNPSYVYVNVKVEANDWYLSPTVTGATPSHYIVQSTSATSPVWVPAIALFDNLETNMGTYIGSQYASTSTSTQLQVEPPHYLQITSSQMAASASTTSASICSGVSDGISATLTTPGTATYTYAWSTTFASAAISTNSPANPATATSESNTITVTNSASSPVTGTYTVTVTDANKCTAVATTATITVTPNATATPGPAQIICGTGGSLSGFSATEYSNITWTTSGSGAFSPSSGTVNPTYIPSGSDITAGSVNITMTAVATAPCSSNATTPAVTITIQKKPTAAAGSAQTLCSSGGTLTGFSAANYSNITWTTSGTGTFSPPSGTVNPTYMPSGADISAGSVNITMTAVATSPCAANATTSPVAVSFQLSVTATPGSAQTICSTGAALSGFSAANYSNITWSTTGTGTFSPSSGTVNPTYTPSPADITAGSVNVVMTAVGTGPCGNAATPSVTITIRKAPVATPGSAQTICSSGGTLTGFSAANYSNVTWGTTGTGTFSPSSGTVNPVYTPSSADTSAGSVNIIMTAVASSPCAVNATTPAVTVTIQKVPVATPGSAQTVCSGGTALTGFAASSYGNITWTTSGTGTFSPSSGTANPVYTPSSHDSTTGSVNITMTATAVSPCLVNATTPAVTITIPASVRPVVAIDPSPDYIICTNTTLHFTATPVNGGASPRYQWQINGGSGYANVGANSPNYSSSMPVNNNLVRCIMTSDATCAKPASDTSNATTMIVGTCNNIWVGNTTDWFDSTNWSANVVPTNCADGANLPPGLTYYPSLTGNASVGNVIIQTGAYINLNTYTLSVCGTWTAPVAGTTIQGTGEVIFDGITNATQTISGLTNIGEIRVNNTGGGQVVMNGSSKVNLYSALDLQQGNMNVSAGTLTFKSTTDSTIAILDNFSPGFTGTITGNITAERYYAASTYWWTDQHEMGSPVDNLPLSKFGATAVTGGYVIPYSQCYEVVMTVGSPNGNVFSYHENSPNAPSCGMAQWYVEPSSGHAVDGQGYSVALRGNGTLTVTGAPNLNSTYTLSGLSNSNWSNTTWEHHLLTSGWQLMTNPYLATLQINTSNPGLDNQVQVWQANGPFSGSYQTHMISEDAVIAPFQAFLVHVTNPGTGNTYTINGGDRTRTPAVFYAQNANELDITAENLTTDLLDKTMVAFNSAATDSFDPQYDGYKMAGSLSRHTLYTQLSNGRWMSRNILNNVATTSTVPMGFEPGANANYNFSFGNLNTFDPTTYIMLEDKQLNIMYNVRNGDYQFSADSTDNWDRFVLHFTPPVVINHVDATCSSLGSINITQPGTANWNYTLTDNNNTVISSGTLNQSNSVYLNAAAGTYTLTLTDNNNYTVTKVIQVNGAQPVTAAFAPSATEVTVQTPVNFTNNSQNANTFSWNFGDGSASNLINPVHTYVTPGTYTVMMTATNAGGCSSTLDGLITVDATGTAIKAVTENDVTMWSNRNIVYVDFGDAGGNVNAIIKIYNVLGQELSEEKYTLNGLYQKEIDDIDAAYVIVSVKNDDKITTKKLFISNLAK